MATRRNPLRRGNKFLYAKPRPEKRKESMPWRDRVVRETSAGMAKLRSEAYARSGGICECGREECEKAPMRLRRVTWFDGQLHHLKPRSDVLERVRFVRRECHDILTGKLQWTRNFKPKDFMEQAG